jgi:hypothetical protein
MSNLNTFNLNNFNAFLEKAKQAVMCDSNCQKQKTAEELKQKYLASETNLASANNQLNVAEKNYLTFTQGELSYNTTKEDDLHKKAKLITSTFNQTFQNDIKQINYQIDTYNGLVVNYKNVVELYLNYKKENIELAKELKDNTSDVLTNERKTYYENQGIDTLNFVYYYILLLVYFIFLVGYIVTALFYQSQLNWKIRFGILLLLIILPFISPWILAFAISVMYKIYDLLPKNIHLSV